MNILEKQESKELLIATVNEDVYGKVVAWKIEPPIPIVHKERTLVGLDPGTVNLGIACYIPDKPILLLQVKMNRSNDPLLRIMAVRTVLRALLDIPVDKAYVTIEGSNFAGNRQTEMGEMRATAMWWFAEREAERVRFAPPNSIRKVVFGNGRTKAEEFWKDTGIPNDALAALSCLYYSDIG